MNDTDLRRIKRSARKMGKVHRPPEERRAAKLAYSKNAYYTEQRAIKAAAEERRIKRQDRHGRELAKREQLKREIQQIRWGI